MEKNIDNYHISSSYNSSYNIIINKGKIEKEVWTIFGDTIENKERIKEKYINIEPYSFIKRRIDKLDD